MHSVSLLSLRCSPVSSVLSCFCFSVTCFILLLFLLCHLICLICLLFLKHFSLPLYCVLALPSDLALQIALSDSVVLVRSPASNHALVCSLLAYHPFLCCSSFLSSISSTIFHSTPVFCIPFFVWLFSVFFHGRPVLKVGSPVPAEVISNGCWLPTWGKRATSGAELKS